MASGVNIVQTDPGATDSSALLGVGRGKSTVRDGGDREGGREPKDLEQKKDVMKRSGLLRETGWSGCYFEGDRRTRDR